MGPADPDSVLVYPDDVERLFVDAARARAPRSTENECVDRLVDRARRLSELFTTDRPRGGDAFPDYAANEEARIAYGLLFFPQSWVRTRFAFVEAIDARGWKPVVDEVFILDLGAGLGAAGWSAAQLLLARGLAERARIVAVDRSKAALDAFHDAMTRCPSSARGIALESRVADLAAYVNAPDARRGSFDLVVASFALNEAFPPGSADAAGTNAHDDAARAWLRDVASLLKPSGLLLLLEPALRETATRLRDLVRPIVEAGGLFVLAPDLSGTIGPPPDDARFFDHEVRRWRKPKSLSRLNLRLRRSLDELTFSFLTLSPTRPAPFPPGARRVRLTSPIARMKGRKAFTAIEARDGTPTRATFDLLDRTLNDDAKAMLRALERGDHVEILDASPQREAGWWRIAGPQAMRVAWKPGGSGEPAPADDAS